jgi:signal transduction histidine kinase
MTAIVLTCSLCFLGVHFLVPATGILPDLPGAFVRAVTTFNLVGILLGSVCMGVVGYVVVNRSERNLVVAYERSEQAFRELKSVQARLIQQEKMASLGALTAGIAHEIKNPLNFINNFSELNEELTRDLGGALDKGDLKEVRALLADPEQNERMINEHGRRADGIVHAMMQHASAGSNQREATDLNALVSDHIDLAYHGKRALHPDFAVDIQRDLCGDVGTVDVVPKEIGRVLLNLLGNAFDAVRERTISVNGQYTPTVRVTTLQRNGRLEIRVSDNGPGIPAGIREKIFEPFFTTKPAGSGTGLGLSLSYDIVTQGHGGSLDLESNGGDETTFIVTLPR